MNGEISYENFEKSNKIGKWEYDENELEDPSDLLSDPDFQLPKSVSNSSAHKSSGCSTKKHKKTLPLALQGLMGQANLCYARGDVQIAEKLCLEIIRQAPMAAEPYLSLSQVYLHLNNVMYVSIDP